MNAPIAAQWTGDSFVPVPRFRRECDARFVVGQNYVLEEREERSSASHRFYFAQVNDLWQSLPEEYGDRFPTSEHLRRYALIRAGFRDEMTMVASSKAEARRIVTFMRPADEYAVVTSKDAIVVRWTAKSQSLRAMDKATFRASADAVLEVIAEMVGVSPDSLRARAA